AFNVAAKPYTASCRWPGLLAPSGSQLMSFACFAECFKQFASPFRGPAMGRCSELIDWRIVVDSHPLLGGRPFRVPVPSSFPASSTALCCFPHCEVHVIRDRNTQYPFPLFLPGHCSTRDKAPPRASYFCAPRLPRLSWS